MTRPRIVDAGATLALCRRTTRRHFLLHPDEARQMEQVYWYCLAYAAQLHGVRVHAACLMSTHYLCAAAHNACYAQPLCRRNIEKLSRLPYRGGGAAVRLQGPGGRGATVVDRLAAPIRALVGVHQGRSRAVPAPNPPSTSARGGLAWLGTTADLSQIFLLWRTGD